MTRVMPSLGGTIKPPEPVVARDEMQNALQWLARMTLSFADAPGRLNLRFDAAGRRFLTPEIAPGTALELALPGLIFQFVENGVAVPHAMDVDDKSSTEIEAWLLVEMLHRGFERETFSKKLPYEWHDPLTGDARKYAPSTHLEELAGLTDALVAASRVLAAVRGAERGEASEGEILLCWPDRLEIGFLSPGHDGMIDVEVGYALGDERTGAVSVFFARPLSRPANAASPTIAAGDVANDGAAERAAIDRLNELLAAARVSATH